MSEAFVGEIRMFAGNYAPEDWAFCDGQLLSISEYQTLFSLLGTTYGGDGQTNFAVPDLRGRLPIHIGTNSGIAYTLGQKLGSETNTLQTSELPAHTHLVKATSDTATVNTPANNTWASTASNLYSNVTTTDLTSMDSTAISSNIGGQAHNNMMPSLTISFIISLVGIYPPRP
ncbi:phage tail protein [Paenibacillus kyungheensis]